MDINKKISQFTDIEGFDNTTQIPVVQGSPLFNAKITPKKFVKTIGDDMMKELNLGNVDNTSDLDKPVSNATREALDEIKGTMVTMTEDEYDNLPNKDPNIYYFIEED